MITAGAVLAALALLVAACGTGGTGARDEGPAHASAVAGAVASPSASAPGVYKKVDAVTLIKQDPQVSTTVKNELKPCSGEEYPVDVTYGRLTGSTRDDVVVNVLTCADAVGIGSYVYRDEGGTYKNVFKTEESPVYAEIDQGLLTVTKQVYKKGDPISSPSGEDVITYDWSGGRFVGRPPVHTDYGKTGTGGDATPAPDN
ncbi:hypothetical protein [Streptomyces broussonetiae]|uniref:Lipoprotein CseA n=1 Tax=Streptomyces broussonetiae TaxID=2686304 RepID=A0A6I6ND93_9ACTN|nr:hypothetical protein [Streptomyces broussonetiae]QHA06097.1 hypothetical protein GQF42_24930 [Streptomyces broussonetiae]